MASAENDPRDAFFDLLTTLCDETFEGYSSFPEEGSFSGQLLTAHVASCTENEIRVPFTVGEDRSRTWIVTRDEEGLLLQHDHRHEDGTPDEITLYGGRAIEGGSGLSQSFAADGHTRALIPEAASNVWTVSLDAEATELTYYLERHKAPRFKATLVRAIPREEG